MFKENVRPYREKITHETCGFDTIVFGPVAKQMAEDPKSRTLFFCRYCKEHRPAREFTWTGTKETVGT